MYSFDLSLRYTLFVRISSSVSNVHGYQRRVNIICFTCLSRGWRLRSFIDLNMSNDKTANDTSKKNKNLIISKKLFPFRFQFIRRMDNTKCNHASHVNRCMDRLK